MGLTKQIEINPIVCISPTRGIEICPVDAAGVQEYQIPTSHETNLVEIAPGTVEDLFVHHFQTDQLLVVKGRIVLTVLQEGQYRYILLSDRDLQVVKIPPGIPHGAINLTSEPCIAINSVIRHGVAHIRDYQPIPIRKPYDLEMARALLNGI
ncbi:dTDP-4-dehydrorhamnose 3,5-epimerase-like enzyme [Leptolyngbyaceae cyanobacterium JSC-12]|nr:dTDP-4-dehydrorhamnose 3,5-epimerase-like enzyme [Leptolyngbyaceae cyanobacterium JSC-12]